MKKEQSKASKGAQNPSIDFGAPHGRAQDNVSESINKLTPPSGMPGKWTGSSAKTGGK